GGDILNSISAFYDIAPIVRGHHERPDGLGYPDGLKAGEIMEESYIIAVADAFDAMTSGRKYRTNFSLEQAIDELKKGKGSQFSDEIVDVFLEVLIDYDNIEKALAWTYQR
ncbi:MAG: HD domain-containing phosphohydrolase, partial [Clostridiales bacterium]